MRKVCGSCLNSREKRAWSRVSAGCSTRRPAGALAHRLDDQVLQPFIGIVGQEQPAGPRDRPVCAVSTTDEPLSTGFGLDDHILNQVVQPGELARLNNPRLCQHDQRQCNRLRPALLRKWPSTARSDVRETDSSVLVLNRLTSFRHTAALALAFARFVPRLFDFRAACFCGAGILGDFHPATLGCHQRKSASYVIMDDKTTQGGAFGRRDGSMKCILPSWVTLRDRRGLELGLVQNRRCSGDGTAGWRAGNKVSSMNSTRMALVGSGWHTFSEVFSAISIGPEQGFFGMGRAEITRAKTTHVPSLVSIDSVFHQPTSGRGSRVSKRRFDRENRRLARLRGKGSDHLFCDVKSICQRLFIPTTSP